MRTTPQPGTRRQLIAAVAATLLALVATTTIVLATGSLQDRSAQPGISFDPTHARVGDYVTVSVRHIEHAQDGYQVYLIPEQAIQEEADRSQGCATQQHEDVYPLHLGATQRHQSETVIEHRATGQLPGGHLGLPEGRYHACVTWVEDGQLRHWAAASLLRVIGRLQFSPDEEQEDAVQVTLSGGAPQTRFALYPYRRDQDGEVCSGGIVLARGATDANGGATLQVTPLKNRIEIGQLICAGKEDGSLMAYGEMNTLPGGDILDINPERGNRDTEIRLTIRQNWPPIAAFVTAYLEARPPPAESECHGQPPANDDPRFLATAPVNAPDAVTMEFSPSAEWIPGSNTVCIRWLHADGSPGSPDVMPPMAARFFLTARTTANGKNNPATPGTPIPINNSELPEGSRLLSMQWQGKTYPVDTFSNPNAGIIVAPLEMHVAHGEDIEESAMAQQAELHWQAPDGQPHTSSVTIYLTPVTIKLDGPNNSIQAFTVALQGVHGERPMAVNYCQYYGSQMPRHVMGRGTAAHVTVNPAELEDISRLRRGVNTLCVELLDWDHYGHEKHYLDGVHPAVATITYDVQTTLTMPESALIGTTVEAVASDLPPGATLRQFNIDEVTMEQGAAYSASAADRFGNVIIRFIVPASVGNRSTVNRNVIIRAVYTDGEDEINASGQLLILPATPAALAGIHPPGELAGVPYLTFRPRSAVVEQNLTVRTRNLEPPDSTLRAVKLNGTLVHGREGDRTAKAGSPEYLKVNTVTTLGEQAVQFIVPTKIGDQQTEYQIEVELHWDPGENNTDPYGNQLIVVKRTIPLFTGDELIEPEECNAIVRLNPADLRAGASINQLRIRVATGSSNRPMNCPAPGAEAGNNTIPQGDVTIRLQGDFQLGAPGQLDPRQANLRANVNVVVLDAQVQEAGHDDGTHSHGRTQSRVEPEGLVSILTISATSITLSPGPLIQGPWSYQQLLPVERTRCLEAPAGGRPERIANLTHGTQYTLQIFNRPGCVASANSGTVTFTTASGSSVYAIQGEPETIEVRRRGDALTLTIPGCEDWTDEGPDGARPTGICNEIRPRFIDFLITIPGLRMPAQATRDPEERVTFTIEWENQGLVAKREIYAYTVANGMQTTRQEEQEDALTPPMVALSNQGLTFVKHGNNVGVEAYGHVQFTDVEFYSIHDGGASDLPPGDARQAMNTAAFAGCAETLRTGIAIPSARSFATARNAATTIDTANGSHARVGLYHVCARGGGGIVTSDQLDQDGRPAYRARYVVGMSAELTRRNQNPSAGQVIEVRIHGYEATTEGDAAYTDAPLVIDEVSIAGRRLIGPVSARPTDWRYWKQDNQILQVMLPPELQGSANLQLWARSPEGSTDRTCTQNVPGRNEDLAAIYESACYHNINITILPPQLEIIQPTPGMTLNEEASVKVSGLPGNQICHATIGPLPVTLLSESGSPTRCVQLSPNGQDSRFRFAMRTPNEGPQTQMVRFYTLNAGDSLSAGDAGGSATLTVITDLNAKASADVNLLAPNVQLLNTGTVRRLDKLVLRGEQFPREHGAHYRINITIGDCEIRCKKRRANSVPLWEFDHIMRRQPRPPGEEIPITVTLAGVPIEVNGSVESPIIAMLMNPERGQAEDAVTFSAQGLEAYRGGYSVHIQSSGGRGPAVIFRNPPQTDGQGEFKLTGIIPWWEHDGGTAEYETVFQLYDGEKNKVDDAKFVFLYYNREAPATPRPTPPATTEPELETIRATPRPLPAEPTATLPDTPIRRPTVTPSLILSAATPEPTPTTTPPPAQPIRSLAELIHQKEPTPTALPEPVPTPAPLAHIGQSATIATTEEPEGTSPWTYIIGGTVLLLVVTAIGIAVLIWKRPQPATVAPMGRVSDDQTPEETPTIVTARGYLHEDTELASPNDDNARPP